MPGVGVDLQKLSDQPDTMQMDLWINKIRNWNHEEDFDKKEKWNTNVDEAISLLTKRYKKITMDQLWCIISGLGLDFEMELECYDLESYDIAMEHLQSEHPEWSKEDLHAIVIIEFPDNKIREKESIQETLHFNGANFSSKEGIIHNNDTYYNDNYNNNDINEDINNRRMEVAIVPLIEVSSPVNMHTNNPFSASVILKDEIILVGAVAPSFLYPLLHFLSSLCPPPSAPPFSLPPFPDTSLAFYLSPFLPPPLLYPLVFLYYFLNSRVRLALLQNGAA